MASDEYPSPFHLNTGSTFGKSDLDEKERQTKDKEINRKVKDRQTDEEINREVKDRQTDEEIDRKADKGTEREVDSQTKR